MIMKNLVWAVLTFFAASAFGQGSIVTATLVSGGASSVYYGAQSFQNAYDASAAGDEIYLSPGVFGGITIAKPIRVVGAGGWGDNVTKITVLSLKIASDTMTIEGVTTSYIAVGQVGNASGKIRIYRCNIKGMLTHDISGQDNILEIINSNVDSLRCYRDYGNVFAASKIFVFNSIIAENGTDMSDGGEYLIQNSIIKEVKNSYLKNALVKNSVLFSNGDIDKSALGIYNTIIAVSGKINEGAPNGDNWEGVDLSSVFVNYASGDYHLQDSTAYIGTDGTQIGIYGGEYPWNTNPTNPRITAKKIANKVTDDDKLSVEITVEVEP